MQTGRWLLRIGELVAVAGTGRVWIWVTAAVTGMATVGLVRVAVSAKPDTTAQIVGVWGAIVSMLSLLASVVALFRGAGGGPGNGIRVRGGRRSIVAGGNITGSAIGNSSKVNGPRSAPSRNTTRQNVADVRAGRDGIAAGGDITDSALGEGSER